MARSGATYSSSIPQVRKRVNFGYRTGARKAAEAWQKGIVQVMAESNPAGRRYWYEGLGWVRASAPGQPPAIQTGEYARSIEVGQVKLSGGGVTYEVGTADPRGIWFEKGTENMRPRPHFREGYERHKDAIQRALFNGIRDAVE